MCKTIKLEVKFRALHDTFYPNFNDVRRHSDLCFTCFNIFNESWQRVPAKRVKRLLVDLIYFSPILCVGQVGLVNSLFSEYSPFMAKKDPRIDAIIQEAAPFAKPILIHLRKVIHKNCPQVEETLKWRMPHFMYEGKILCGMGAFKSHCIMGFWKGSHLVDDDGKKAKMAMGQLGRITSVKDLPSDKKLASYIKQAMELNEAKSAAPKRTVKHKKLPLKPPSYFLRALKANKKALAHFNAFSPSCQREYVEWIVSAKTEETRERRLETAIDWMSEGKTRNWKYKRP